MFRVLCSLAASNTSANVMSLRSVTGGQLREPRTHKKCNHIISIIICLHFKVFEMIRQALKNVIYCHFKSYFLLESRNPQKF